MTLFIDKREVVTLMTLGTNPELLVLGYLRNQRLVPCLESVDSIQVDWESEPLMGAAGSVEAVFSIMALVKQFVPPTINLHTPDPECDLDYTPNVGVSAPVHHVMSNSFGFGGHNAVLIFSEYQS